MDIYRNGEKNKHNSMRVSQTETKKLIKGLTKMVKPKRNKKEKQLDDPKINLI
jgi:hypothetical protein